MFALLLCPTLAAAQPSDIGTANRAFATAIYGELAKQDGNLIFSPMSIQLALAMTSEGALGETAEQMRKVLHLPASLDRRALMSIPENKAFELRIANKLWGQRGYPFQQAFLDITAKQYEAKLEAVDFRSNADAERVRINDWVKENTSGKIRDLIPPKVLTALTRLVLTNAIYFKGKWQFTFDKKLTKSEPFFLAGGKSVKAPLMTQHGELGYHAIDGAQLVSLPYKGDAIDMVLIVPNSKDGLPAVEKRLGQLGDWLAGLQRRELDIFMPRFRATLAVPLGEILSTLGMPLAFSQSADFDGIASRKDTGEPPLFISAVIHKALVEVNEEGTVAAAATAVVMGTADAHVPVVVRADHPFLYVIRDIKTGRILFMGRESDPTTE